MAAGFLSGQVRLAAYGVSTATGTALDGRSWKCIREGDVTGLFGVIRDNAPVFGAASDTVNNVKEGDYKGGLIRSVKALIEGAIWFRPPLGKFGTGKANLSNQGGGVVKGTNMPIIGSRVPDIGNKLNYILGKATGKASNIKRSTDMARQLNKIGIFDNASGRNYLKEHLIKTFNSSKGILVKKGYLLRESMLMGPNGGIKIESIWKNNKLITVYIKS